MQDDIDQIMQVMDAAFDPAFGEAWNRRQVSDALLIGNCHYLLANRHGAKPQPGESVCGFALSRRVLDEEELLLLAVLPEARGMGIGTRLLQRVANIAADHGVTKLFLEMREGNPAQKLYTYFGFNPIGRRKSYYKMVDGTHRDAITLVAPL